MPKTPLDTTKLGNKLKVELVLADLCYGFELGIPRRSGVILIKFCPRLSEIKAGCWRPLVGSAVIWCFSWLGVLGFLIIIVVLAEKFPGPLNGDVLELRKCGFRWQLHKGECSMQLVFVK